MCGYGTASKGCPSELIASLWCGSTHVRASCWDTTYIERRQDIDVVIDAMQRTYCSGCSKRSPLSSDESRELD